MLSSFREIWVVDFEYTPIPGGRPIPLCVVAREIRSGRLVRLRKDEFGPLPPYPTDKSVCFVAYFASAELTCHAVLGWPMPERVLDLYVEFRERFNGLKTVAGNGMLGACAQFGIPHISEEAKKKGRGLAIRGGHFTPSEKAYLVEYCLSDVDAEVKLLDVMLPGIDIPRAIGIRGRYMPAVARIQHAGVPIHVGRYTRLVNAWEDIQAQLIADMDASYGVYREDGVFDINRMEALLDRLGLLETWPRLASGRINLDDRRVLRGMAKAYPVLNNLRELRHSLSGMRLFSLEIGPDGRNRALIPAFSEGDDGKTTFRSKTGRNQPSNAKFIFGPSVWIRGLITPEPDYGLVYRDWVSQEIGIAAFLSGDLNLIDAYQAGDVYIAFGKKAGLIPHSEGNTKKTLSVKPKAVRELCKQCVLGTAYGMGAQTLAGRIGQQHIVARQLLAAHRNTFPKFWDWARSAVQMAMLTGSLPTVFNWRQHIDADSNPRSLLNYPMQANGAEMLRLACIFATERGVEVVAPVHDAILIHAPLEKLEEHDCILREAMAEASRIVLGGFELPSEGKVFRYPDHFMDEERGREMWETVWRHVERVELSRRFAA